MNGILSPYWPKEGYGELLEVRPGEAWNTGMERFGFRFIHSDPSALPDPVCE